MASPVHVPRVNNNDDEVKLVALNVAVGERVVTGQVIASVETDKAIVDVEAPADAFVLAVHGVVDEIVTVGKVLLWLGATADEPVPVAAAPAQSATVAQGGKPPTAKA